jgi:hypothetical protein
MKLEIAVDLSEYKYGLLSAKLTLTYLGDDHWYVSCVNTPEEADREPLRFNSTITTEALNIAIQAALQHERMCGGVTIRVITEQEGKE